MPQGACDSDAVAIRRATGVSSGTLSAGCPSSVVGRVAISLEDDARLRAESGAAMAIGVATSSERRIADNEREERDKNSNIRRRFAIVCLSLQNAADPAAFW